MRQMAFTKIYGVTTARKIFRHMICAVLFVAGISAPVYAQAIRARGLDNARTPLVATEKIVAVSPDPSGIFLYTPAIVVNDDGTLVAAVDYGGPGTGALDGPKSSEGDYSSGNQIRIYLSDNRGRSWTETDARIPMMHEILFKAGGHLYMIGHSDGLLCTRSDDGGRTWSELSMLRSGSGWHQSCGAVDIHDGIVTLVYERKLPGEHLWPGVGPVLMQADENADLTDPDAWRYSALYNPDPDIIAAKPSGIPALEVSGESVGNAGILEANVVRINNPDSHLYDSSGVVIMMRANTGFKDIGVMLRGRTDEDGNPVIERIVKKGEPIFYVHIPGGHLKFHIQYDPESELYWMVHSHINGTVDERRRLALSFSADLLTWTLAGIVAVGPADNAARNYATLAISGDDILILSRSGDENAKNNHDNNLVTFHRVRNFRKLIY